MLSGGNMDKERLCTPQCPGQYQRDGQGGGHQRGRFCCGRSRERRGDRGVELLTAGGGGRTGHGMLTVPVAARFLRGRAKLLDAGKTRPGHEHEEGEGNAPYAPR